MKTNTEETAQAIAASLSQAGILKSYHKKKLEDFGEQGKLLKGIATTDGFKSIVVDNAKGFTIIDDRKGEGEALLQMAARSCVLKRMDVQLIDVVDLAYMVETDRMDELYDLHDRQALFVSGMHRAWYDKNPYDPKTIRRLEYFFYKTIEQNISLSIHVQADIDNQTWWDSYSLKNLKEKNWIIK